MKPSRTRKLPPNPDVQQGPTPRGKKMAGGQRAGKSAKTVEPEPALKKALDHLNPRPEEKSSAPAESSLQEAAADVNSSSTANTANSSTPTAVPSTQEKKMKFTLVTGGKSKLVRYQAEGLKGLIRISPSALNGAPPAEVESLDALPWAEPSAPKEPKAKRVPMTPEQREARRAELKARTPEQVAAAARERAEKALARAAALEAKASQPQG